MVSTMSTKSRHDCSGRPASPTRDSVDPVDPQPSRGSYCSCSGQDKEYRFSGCKPTPLLAVALVWWSWLDRIPLRASGNVIGPYPDNCHFPLSYDYTAIDGPMPRWSTLFSRALRSKLQNLSATKPCLSETTVQPDRLATCSQELGISPRSAIGRIGYPNRDLILKGADETR